MAFLRADTAKSFVSRQWTTSALEDGLAHLLQDGSVDLPDDLNKLQDHGFLSWVLHGEVCTGSPLVSPMLFVFAYLPANLEMIPCEHWRGLNLQENHDSQCFQELEGQLADLEASRVADLALVI